MALTQTDIFNYLFWKLFDLKIRDSPKSYNIFAIFINII